MRQYTRNIEACANNLYQNFDNHKRVVTVCSGGCLRSPTAAVILAEEPWRYNTRSAGLTEMFAIVYLDDILFNWADEIVVMEQHMKDEIRLRWPDSDTPIVVLNIKDNYSYRDPDLVRLIRERYTEITK
jgi:predicted protein tyrosine phosphatase